ncbi:bacteriocin biosynthesis protein AlbD [Bacillus atrophaeus]|uniref:bacteriocin biosynthesis protein AlbD n=1 Tax=Bacillus atrophaeus TaxID=1452 RepID=UPI00228085AC|nr:bacteriocin biosynthesis protein AlbD [Bacillus atrophaeus]MCY8097046.1 bacteriocin biosynthesis protein AlbD [Bacillus atrophaeus]MCY9169085.1 bacteriocin biosynthesis protein AlbD [Bacillus atrophaeus]MCY9204762.1 bacteriocin biosynthesis protein AlbD [Bacillus atrophaeus]
MNNVFQILTLLFKQLYGRQGKKDAIRITAGLAVLALFEIGLIRQAGIDESVLGKTYVTLALLFMNVYMVFLSISSQWKESYMKLSCLLPISSRSFWLAQSVVLFVDTCLRRTLFFFILPLFLFGTGTLSGTETLFWLGKFSFFTVYSILLGVLLSNLFVKKKGFVFLLHAAAFACICASVVFMPALTIPLCGVHMAWGVFFDFPSFLQVPDQQNKMHSFMRTSEFSFYKREWNRFISSKAMLLNYIVMAAFSGFFSFQMMKTGIADQHIIYIVITALLLICSPIAFFYSLKKHDRMLLITLPIKRRTMFWAKYRFYSGLLAGGFILIAMIVGLISSQPISFMTFLQCIELLLMGAFIRLTSDEKRPSFGWQTEQQLWSGFSKYRSYVFCIPLFLATIAGTVISLAIIPIAGLIIVYLLQKQEGGFFDTRRKSERFGNEPVND